MVTRLYSPVYPKPGRMPPPSSVRQPADRKPENEASLTASADNPVAVDTVNPDGQKRYDHLATIQDQQRGQKIQLDSVLADFQQTMSALNTTPETASKLDAYLSVVHIQGQESQPNVGLIKNTLLTAGKTLDHFIETSVGQPSTVVHDWVKALISQDIDYKTQSKWQSAPPSVLSTPVPGAATQPTGEKNPASTPELSLEDKQRLQQWIQAAKTQPADRAVPLLSQALIGLDGKNRPDLESKVQALLAHNYWQSGNLSAATHTMQSAWEKAPSPDKQQRLSIDLAHLLLKQGQISQALTHLSPFVSDTQTVTALKPSLQARVYQDYGQALQATGEAQQAVGAYQQALKVANQAKLPGVFEQTLPNLATSYLSLNQPDLAFRALQRYQQLVKPASAS